MIKSYSALTLEEVESNVKEETQNNLNDFKSEGSQMLDLQMLESSFEKWQREQFDLISQAQEQQQTILSDIIIEDRKKNDIPQNSNPMNNSEQELQYAKEIDVNNRMLNLNYPNLISTLDSDELPIFDDILDDLVSNFDKDDQISAIKLQELPDNKPFQSKFNDQISSQPIEKNFQIHNHLRNFYTGFKRFLIKQYKGNEYSLKLEQFFSNKKKNQQNIPKNHFFFLLNQFKIINDKADFDSLLQNQKSYFDQSKQEHINFREFQVLQHYHNNLIKNKEDYNCIVKYVNEKNKENSQYLKEYCQFYHMQKVMLFGYKSKQGRQNNNHKKQKRIKKYREEQILINTFLLIAAENPKIL